jgi:acyl carrier protein
VEKPKGKNMAMTRDGILQRVQEVLVDALGVYNDEVTTDATLMGDLGAESIDFLDIIFRLEKAFGIKFNRMELLPAEKLKNNPKFVSNGKLTAAGLVELKSEMPNIQIAKFEEDPNINKLSDLLTIETIVNYVDMKINNG